MCISGCHMTLCAHALMVRPQFGLISKHPAYSFTVWVHEAQNKRKYRQCYFKQMSQGTISVDSAFIRRLRPTAETLQPVESDPHRSLGFIYDNRAVYCVWHVLNAASYSEAAPLHQRLGGRGQFTLLLRGMLGIVCTVCLGSRSFGT